MLKGINVLNTYDIVSSEYHDIIFPAVVFTCIAVGGMAIIIYLLLDSKRIRDAVVPLVIVVIFTLFAMVAAIYGFTNLPENKYQTRYEVTISNDVNFNEFSSKYQVVKQEGLIYTIVEKTDKG